MTSSEPGPDYDQGFLLRLPEAHGTPGDFENGWSFYSNGNYYSVPSNKGTPAPPLSDAWTTVGYIEENNV